MKTRISKWVEGNVRGDRTRKITVRALRKLLKSVRHYLPLAATKAATDVEYVHNLRIWTRRATAALKLYDEFLPRRRAVWLKKQLKRIRQATGDARDLDVLAQYLTQDPAHPMLKRCMKRIRAMREKAQEPLLAVRKRLKRDNRFNRQIKKLLRRVRRESKRKFPPFGPWAYAKLRPIVNNFFKAAPGKEAKLGTLHQFRICGKELRYTMELLTRAFPSEFHQKLYPIVEGILDRLGKINDLSSAQARLRQLLNDMGNVAEKRQLRSLISQEQTRLEQAHQEFLDWAIPHLDKLRSSFDDLLTPKLAWKSEKRVGGRDHK